MKQLPSTTESCLKCPFRITYQTDKGYKDYCRLTGKEIKIFNVKIDENCPLGDVK